MATISQIKVGGTSYDIKATYDGNGNTITSYYVKKSGDTMTGALTLTQGSYVHSASGTSGTTGYVQVCELIISANYQNHPIEIGFSRRGDSGMTRLYIAFKNANTVDPELNYFTYIGATNAAYLVKSATSTWHLYIAKTEGYDNINIIEYHKPQYMTGTTLTWTNVHATTLPAGYVQATLGGNINYAASAGTVSKATAANLTTTANAVAYYTNTTGTFGSKASANGALYATSANGALSWGTLPIAQGGTGQTSAQNAINYLLNNGCAEGTSPAQLNDYLIAQYAGGGTTTTTYHRRKISNVMKAFMPGVITVGTAAPSGGSNGDIYIQYS